VDVPARLDAFDLTGALDRIWSFVRELNRYVTDRKPWELARDESRSEELDQVLFDLADGLRVAAVALAAYLPETAPRILAALGQPLDVSWQQVAYGALAPAKDIAAATPLFPRIEAVAAAGAA
jgi:methionyl-tRNA synthetase